jgi:hypothetical protein
VIIDSHAHVVVPDESYKFMAELVASRANPVGMPKLTDEAVRKAGQTILDIMDRVGTDIQFLSPRPFMQMHSIKPAKVTALWTKHMNDLIFRTVQMFPTRFRAVAGLPQTQAIDIGGELGRMYSRYLGEARGQAYRRDRILFRCGLSSQTPTANSAAPATNIHGANQSPSRAIGAKATLSFMSRSFCA